MLAAAAAVAAVVGRDEGRREAAHELAKSKYHADDPSLLQRVLTWIGHELARLLHTASTSSPGGIGGLLLLLAVVAVVIVVLVRRSGAPSRTARLADVELSGPVPASAHRGAAERAAAAGRWDEAVLEWMRAVVRELEARGVLEPRPGRTAAEVARDAGRRAPEIAADLRTGAAAFDRVVYGRVPATAADEAQLRALDVRVQHVRLPTDARRGTVTV